MEAQEVGNQEVRDAEAQEVQEVEAQLVHEAGVDYYSQGKPMTKFQPFPAAS